MDFTEGQKKQLMRAGRWNQSALKPHLVSNGKNIKDYYPRRQKGHQHLPQRAQAKFRGPISQGAKWKKKKKRSQLNTNVDAQTSVSGFFFLRAIKKVHANRRPLRATFQHSAAAEMDVFPLCLCFPRPDPLTRRLGKRSQQVTASPLKRIIKEGMKYN